MSNSENPLGDTLGELQTNIRRKAYALEVLDSEYSKLSEKTHTYHKRIDELATKMYNLDHCLKSIECRVKEYNKKEKDWESEAIACQRTMDELKCTSEDENKISEMDDQSYVEAIFNLLAQRRKDREHQEKSSTREQLESLEEATSGIKQETADLRKALVESKRKNPFQTSHETDLILKNLNLSDFIKPVITELEKVKNEKIETLKKLKGKIEEMEEEINKLSTQ